MITLVEVAQSYQRGARAVTEASLSRVMTLAQRTEKGQGSFAVLTSWLAPPKKTVEENEQDFWALKRGLSVQGYGFRTLLGHWLQCMAENVPYNRCPPDQLKDSVEPSLFITGIPFEHAKEIALIKYKQDGFIYAGPETDGKVTIFLSDGGKDVLGKWAPGVLEQGYSQLYRRKRNGVFKNLQHAATQGTPFTFTQKDPAQVIPISMAAESREVRQLKFIELRPESFIEGLLFAKYSYLRDAMLQDLTESRNAR